MIISVILVIQHQARRNTKENSSIVLIIREDLVLWTLQKVILHSQCKCHSLVLAVVLYVSVLVTIGLQKLQVTT